MECPLITALKKKNNSRIFDLRTLYHIKFEDRLTYTTHLIQAQLALIGIIRSIFFPLKSEVSVKTNLVLFYFFSYNNLFSWHSFSARAIILSTSPSCFLSTIGSLFEKLKSKNSLSVNHFEFECSLFLRFSGVFFFQCHFIGICQEFVLFFWHTFILFSRVRFFAQDRKHWSVRHI